LREASFAALQAIAPVANWWDKQKQPAPLVMALSEMQRAADVFAIEWLDMRENHRVLHGADVLANLQIPMRLHRFQVEYELREKLVLLRQAFLLAGNNAKQLWNVTMRATPSFSVLFRHALIALGETPPPEKTEVVRSLATLLEFDPTVLVEVFDLHRRAERPGHSNIKRICSHYLAVIEQVTAAVDRMMDSQP
jgi:hypothetical protein